MVGEVMDIPAANKKPKRMLKETSVILRQSFKKPTPVALVSTSGVYKDKPQASEKRKVEINFVYNPITSLGVLCCHHSFDRRNKLVIHQ